MDLAGLTIDPARLGPGQQLFESPLAVIELDRGVDAVELVLPPCPVIGIGDPSHPLASRLDAVIEPPVELGSLVQHVRAQPLAAAVAIGLLRTLPDLAADQALTAESLAYGMLQGSAEHRTWLRATAADRAAPATRAQVRLERADPCLTITLDSPDRGNSIDAAMRDQLYEAFALAALDPEIETVRLRGEGRVFSLGAELSEFGTTTDPATAHAIRMRTLPAWMIARCADKLDVHVQGACVGAGLEMAAWARRITAAPNAWFQLPELAMGLIPGAGGCVSLSRRIGRSRTALMVLSGRRLSARAALAWGLIDAIVDQPA